MTPISGDATLEAPTTAKTAAARRRLHPGLAVGRLALFTVKRGLVARPHDHEVVEDHEHNHEHDDQVVAVSEDALHEGNYHFAHGTSFIPRFFVFHSGYEMSSPCCKI